MVKGRNRSLRQGSWRMPELEDFSWFPGILRCYQTDFLGKLAATADLYTPAARYLGKYNKGCTTILDMASGSGIPGIQAAEYLIKQGALLLLSDKFPSSKPIAAQNTEHIQYLVTSLDVTMDDLPTAEVYLMVNSLHHFNNVEIENLIHKIRHIGGNFFFVEPLQPSLWVLVKVVLSTLLGPILLVPFIRPFHWSRIILTYLLPLGILVTMWDGIVSTLKSYSKKELSIMATHFSKEGFVVEAGFLKGPFGRLSYLSHMR